MARKLRVEYADAYERGDGDGALRQGARGDGGGAGGTNYRGGFEAGAVARN